MDLNVELDEWLLIVVADFVCFSLLFSFVRSCVFCLSVCLSVCPAGFLVRVFVHFVDRGLEILLHFVALRFHCWREKTILDAEQIMVQVNVLGLIRHA